MGTGSTTPLKLLASKHLDPDSRRYCVCGYASPERPLAHLKLLTVSLLGMLLVSSSAAPYQALEGR